MDKEPANSWEISYVMGFLKKREAVRLEQWRRRELDSWKSLYYDENWRLTHI